METKALGLGLLIQGSVGEAREQYSMGFKKCSNSKELTESMKDLEKAMESRGSMPGGEEVLKLFMKRSKESQGKEK